MAEKEISGTSMVRHQMVSVDSIKALMKLKPPSGQDYSIFAYALNKDMISSDGSVDDFYGIVIPLGNYTEEKAMGRAKDIIGMTGHDAIIVCKTGMPFKLSKNLKPEDRKVINVDVDTKGKLVSLSKQKELEEKARLDEKERIENEILKEKEDELDPDNIEHFRHQCYLAIKNKASCIYYQQQVDKMSIAYQNRRDKVRDHYKRHPEHEPQFLDFLEKKLKSRGEDNIFIAMKAGYDEIRDDLLGIEIKEEIVIKEEEKEEEKEGVENITPVSKTGGTDYELLDVIDSTTSAPVINSDDSVINPIIDEEKSFLIDTPDSVERDEK